MSQILIDINDEINGVFLPTSKNNGADPGIMHNGRHPDDYVQNINKKIVETDQKGGNTAVQKVLR